ncbi:MAG TPA: PAS domain-containing sensor histidine kinase, partial [Thermomicrobiales bacterium]|nr:PAS domain-containing sensor histidine kinase [Thermomicrobiales bacterium]
RDGYARGESFSMEFMLESPDGNRRWFEATGAPLDPGQNQGGVVVIRDITDRSLRRLQDQFMAMASHELRTPLTALHASLQMIQRHLRGTERQPVVDRYLAVVADQIHGMRRYIDDLMDVARLQSGKFTLARTPIDMLDVARRAVTTAELLAPDKEIAFHGVSAAFMLGDDSRLEQVLLNLLNNAMTHAPEADRTDVCVRAQASDIEISVHDHGPGVPAEELTHIFSRFAQLDHTRQGGSGGLGLGLYIANEIVASHGGRIDVTSDPAGGTTFTVHLPLIREDEGM